MTLQRPSFPHPHLHLDLVRAFSQGPRALRRSWILATLVGETLGFLVPVLVAGVAFDLPPLLTLVLMVLAGTAEGAILGGAQAFVLGREFLGFSRSEWTSATAVGAAAAWAIGMLPSTFSSTWADWPAWLLVSVAAVLGFLLLGCIGFVQWTVLRRHVARSRTWVPVNAVAWLLGLGVLLAISTPLWREGQSTPTVLAIGALGGLAMAFSVAVVTGFWLARLVDAATRPHADRPAPPDVPAREWAALEESTDHFHLFDPEHVGDLPEPVQRWVRHAVEPGSHLLSGVEAEWVGHLLLRGSWRPFYARHRATLAGGFVWAARTRLFGLPVTGFDRFTGDAGEMRWRLMRRVRLPSAGGEEVTRSAAGRHAIEMLLMVPAVALDPAVRWEPVDHVRATAHLEVGGVQHAVTVSVDLVGRLREIEMERWGSPPGSPYGNYRFGALLGEERPFDGYLVPTQVVAGWHFGTDLWNEGIFLRYQVARCSFH